MAIFHKNLTMKTFQINLKVNGTDIISVSTASVIHTLPNYLQYINSSRI